MTVAGTLSFVAPRELVRTAGEWLLNDFRADETYVTRRPTILTADDDIFEPVMLTHAWCIGRRLLKQAKRRHPDPARLFEVTVTLTRRDAAWICENLPPRSLPRHERSRGAAVIFRDQCKRALKRRRGRRALTDDEVFQRIEDWQNTEVSYWYRMMRRDEKKRREAERRELWRQFYRERRPINVPTLISVGAAPSGSFDDWLDKRRK